MKRVLIITYYWPPTGGSGVQRWVKFVKYLPALGWQPVIYTPLNPEQSSVDHSLEREIPTGVEVVKRKILEPYALYRKKGNKEVNPISSSGKKSLFGRIALFVRANFFIPDPRCMWINPSVRFLKKYISEHPVDLVVSTGPPQSMHLIARKLSKKMDLPWVADFRDPWTEIFYFKHLPMLESVYRKHRKLEQQVLDDTQAIVTVTDKMRDEFEIRINTPVGEKSKIHVITNGFDPDDFKTSTIDYEEKFTITHTGLFSKDGNCTELWRVLGEICRENLEFKKDLLLRIIGKVDGEVRENILIEGLEENTLFMGYMPHDEVVLWQQRASLLLLPLRDEPEAGAILTGKFFEYLAAGREILAFGPVDGELAGALKETSAGTIFDFHSSDGLKELIERIYKNYKKYGNSLETGISDNQKAINRYSRVKLTERMVEIFEHYE